MAQEIRRYRSDHALDRCGTVEAGVYRSRWHQGLRAGMEWLRLSLDLAEAAAVGVYTSDELPGDGGDALAPSLERTADDLLLYGVRGRYLRFTVTPAQALRGYELAFPGRSIDDQLPLVMQEDETLRKLLGVYQSLYQDLSRDIAGFPRRLDPLADDPLPELPEWLGAARWMRAGLPAGKLLAAAPRLNRLRGTRAGLDLLLELVTGTRCTIVENLQWAGKLPDAKEQDACGRLYGAAPNSVALLLPAQVSEDAVWQLKSILEDFIPTGVSCSIVHLREDARMDGHSYLDDNAELVERPAARMDGEDYDTLTLE